jgi:hypothetical protein
MNISSIIVSFDTLSKTFNNMSMAQLEMQTTFTKRLSDIAADNKRLLEENTKLNEKVQELSNNFHQRLPEPSKLPTLVLGSSLVKHMDEIKMKNTKVMCLPGATLNKIKECC